jgi:cytochrome P450
MLKSPIHTGPVQVGRTTTVQYAVEDSEHGRQRRALSHSFSTNALMEQEPIIQSYMDKVVSSFRRMAKEDKEFNIGDWFCYFTFDTMGDLSFGEGFGCLERGEYQEWVEYLFHTIKDGALIQATRRIAGIGTPLQSWLQGRMKGMGDALSYHLTHTSEKVEKYARNRTSVKAALTHTDASKPQISNIAILSGIS